MSIFEDILEKANLDKEIYKVLGLPDPAHNLPGEGKEVLGDPFITTWLYANKMLVGMGVVILILVIFLLTLK